MSTALRAWQERVGLSERAAAAALGISYGTYTSMRGTRLPNRDMDKRTAYACAAIEAGLHPECPEWADRRTVLALAAYQAGLSPITDTPHSPPPTL